RVQTNAPAIGLDVFRGIDVAGKAVLIETGWSRRWGTEAYLSGHPFLTEEAARWLRDAGARLVGIDSLNIDDMADKRRPVHTLLLGAEIPIVEHMTNLTSLPPSGFRFFAAPVKVKALGTFPVRAFAVAP
ncbi:MAG: arylformamidase, partial [Bryobacterales bacterium]|nr:arylformamidase [Bryobacterales bacterium]